MNEIIKPKKQRKFLKALGKIGEVLIQELFFKVGSNLIRKIGGKKTLPSILFLFLSLSLFAQYPNTLNKQRLGFQTTGDGLVWRGSLSDTASIQPINNQNAWVILDTVNLKMYSFDFTSNVWNLVGGAGFTQPLDSLFFNVNVPTNNVDTAKMRWDSDLATVVLGLNDNVPNELGFKNFWLVKNQTGSTITKGSIVYANGTVGASGRITVDKFIANGSIDAKYLLGITAHDLTDGEDGYVISFGKIRQVNTDTFVAGSILYPSSTTAGVWTDVEPVAPNIDMPIGFCINSSSNNGTIAIRVASGYSLSELHDVAITSPVENSSLYYKGGLWRDTTATLLVSDTASMLTPYLRLSGGTLTGTLNGTSLNFSSGAVFNENANNSDFRVESVGRPNMLYVDAFYNRVGIGTGSPQETLEVSGTLRVNELATFRQGGIFSYTGSPNSNFIIIGSQDTMFFVNVYENKIGIRKSSPTKTLDVNGTLNVTDSVTLGNTLSVIGNITENNLNVLTSADTLSMLTPYFRDSDTSLLNLTSRFANKLNISDTASMLTSYLRKADTTNMLLPYFRDADTTSLNLTSRFNTKQNTLNGTGFVKANGTSITYDNSSYLRTGLADSTYLKLSGGTLTGTLNGTSQSLNSNLTISDIIPNNPPSIFTSVTTGPSTSATVKFGLNVNNSGSANMFLGGTQLGGGSGTNPNIFFTDTRRSYASIQGIYTGAGINSSGHIAFNTTPNDTTTALTERMRIGQDGAITISGTLNATGATTLGSTLAVTGDITENGNNVITSADTTSMLLPYWRSGRFSGVLPVLNGGTNRTTMPNNYILFGDGNGIDTSNQLFWDRTNNRLGVGTNNPIYKLDVQGSSNTVNMRMASNTANDILLYFTGNVTGDINMFQSAVDATGSVTAQFVNQNTTTGNAFLNMQVPNASTGDPYLQFTTSGSTNYSFGIDNSDSDKFKFHSAATPSNSAIAIYTLTTDGKFGIQTESPSEVLHVAGNARITAMNGINDIGASATGVLQAATSDMNLKNTIKDSPFGLNEILLLKPVTFLYNDENRKIDSDVKEVGFIAQDVFDIIPNAVSSTGTGDLQLDYRAITAALVKAIQEQQALIKALEQRILNLENK